jgi:hypothetical protein
MKIYIKDDEKAEMKDILEMKRVHEKLTKKRQAEREARILRLEADQQRGYEMKEKERRYANA